MKDMTQAIILDEEIQVNRPLSECFWYISHFDNIAQWDPAVAGAHCLSSGMPGKGSEYSVEMNAGFTLHYTVVEFEKDSRIFMTVNSKLFTAEEEIRFSSNDAGQTRIRYIATFRFPAVLTLLHSVRPKVMQSVGQRALEGMREALENNYSLPEGAYSDFEDDSTTIHPAKLWQFTRLGYNRSKHSYEPISADMRRRHVVLTGATSGLGLASAQQLAAMGARLTLVVRNADKGKRLMEELQANSGNQDIRIEVCDMSLRSEVLELAERLIARAEPIDVLINNAGALFNQRAETEEGFEQSFALLLLNPYLLTEKVFSLLESAGSARVINVLSGGMYSQKIRVDDLQSATGTYSGAVAYARAKRALQIVTEEWAKQWDESGIVVNSMHPGWADTPGVEDSLPGFHRLMSKLLRTPEEGADTIIWLAAATEAGKISGRFWMDRMPQPVHMFERTRETLAEREELLAQLSSMAYSPRCSAA